LSFEEAALAELIGTLGSQRFEPALAVLVRALCAPGSLHDLHLITDSSPQGKSAHRARQGPSHECIDCLPPVFTDRAQLHFCPYECGRSLVCGRVIDVGIGIVLNTDLPQDVLRDRLGPWRGLLLVSTAQHTKMMSSGPSVDTALTILEDIEECLAAASQFTKREAQVSARVLFGLSSIGIALDLGVSEQTVKSYRKRAYQRLAIGSEREMLNWYLKTWSHWRHK
jgi:DNA-binding CsgD family transcriptional regulator